MIVTTVLAPNPGVYTGPGTNTFLVADSGEAVIIDPGPVIAAYIEHRLAREREIVKAISEGVSTVGDLVDVVYAFVPIDLKAAATQQVIVQLRRLYADELVWFPAGDAGPSTMVELNVR